jgi:uncharacterized membrane protein
VPAMKKLLNFLALLSFQIGYLPWSKDKALFIFQAEDAIWTKAMTNPSSVLHPFIIVPLAGQLLLLYTMFQKEPHKAPTFIGLVCLGLLMLILLFIGISLPDIKILTSTLPFFTVAVLILRKHKKQVI